jgi:branched-subunit amino acid transport protein
MTATAAFAAIVTVGLLTYAARGGPLLFLAGRQLPVVVERALRYVGPAVLAALSVTLIADGGTASSIAAEEWAALGVTIVVAAVTRNLIVTLALGMSTLWLLLWLL